jgi:hypothetical protein
MDEFKPDEFELDEFKNDDFEFDEFKINKEDQQPC